METTQALEEEAGREDRKMSDNPNDLCVSKRVGELRNQDGAGGLEQKDAR